MPLAEETFGEGTILLADDDVFILDLGKRMLRLLGFTPLTASDGLDAVEAFKEHGDDIVCAILDLTMPRMSGADAFKEIRNISPDVKVLFCSGSGEREATEEYANDGRCGFLHKPYTLKDLEKKLREILK